MEHIAKRGPRLLAQLGKHNPIDNPRNPETQEWWNNKPLTQRYPLTSQTWEPGGVSARIFSKKCGIAPDFKASPPCLRSY